MARTNGGAAGRSKGPRVVAATGTDRTREALGHRPSCACCRAPRNPAHCMTQTIQADASTERRVVAVPDLVLLDVCVRFLRFGLVAWGGPVAQIAMLRHALVDEERWVTSEHFNRVLALYQVLPGPEAHEMCVYFGTLARGRLGGIAAGLGFMLPGFVLMFILSWFYLTYGIASPVFQSMFLGFQVAVVALIVRAVHRIGGHALYDRWLLGIAAVALAGALLGAHFAITLIVAGLTYVLV